MVVVVMVEVGNIVTVKVTGTVLLAKVSVLFCLKGAVVPSTFMFCNVHSKCFKDSSLT